MSKLAMVAFGLFMLGLFAVLAYQANAFYSYPCEAFKTGHLSLSYAPARCMQ